MRYDLLKHGYRLEDVGTRRLWWADACAIIEEQPPQESAVYRKLYPEEFDHTKIVDRLETIAVLLVRGQMLMGKQSEVKESDMPSSWDDLFPEPEPEAELMSFDDIDRRMGWGIQPREPAAIEMMTFEQIDERMGWDNAGSNRAG